MASSAFVTYILTNDLLYDLVLRSVDPCTLVRLARTCRIAHSAVHSHINRSFNINTHFSRYFPDPLAFRSLQAATGTLVSGSNALQFLDRTFWPECDLDLYCFYDARADVGEWLQEQGYTFEPSAHQNACFRVAMDHPRTPRAEFTGFEESCEHVRSISAIYTFCKSVTTAEGKDTKLKIQIVVAVSSPMKTILEFHSTLVLNVISFSHAYSLYPRATFHHRVALGLFHDHALAADRVQAKYTPRGWQFISGVWPPTHPARKVCLRFSKSLSTRVRQVYLQGVREDQSLALSFPTGLRWIGDSHSWVLPLPIEGIQVLQNIGGRHGSTMLAPDPSMATTWKMIDGLSLASNHPTAKRIKSRTITGRGFRYSYVISDSTLKRVIEGIQQLHDSQESSTRDDYCDEKFLEYCKDMLEDRKLWSVWYPRSSR